ncbi:MAG: hypothetical protein GF347_05610 [Candidatus Moranbacteria bacterium]|nr:hypothetical protein [Candidatus Moranbacteria bacterium]
MKSINFKRLGVGLLALLFLGCFNDKTQDDTYDKINDEVKPLEDFSKSPFKSLVPKKIDNSVEVVVHEFEIDAKKDKIEIIKLDKEQFDLRIEESSSNPKLITQWAKGLSESILINGGYFDNTYNSTGFLVVKGQVLQAKEYDFQKSGLIEVKNDVLRIRDLLTEPIKPGETFDYALQSYPFIIKNGEGWIAEDTGLKARRTAVGQDDEGNLYIIIVKNGNLSLFRFMEELLKTDFDFKYVLNLDGGGSTGLVFRYADLDVYYDSFYKVPNVLIFEKTND